MMSLPMLSGVSPSYIWLPQGSWQTIYAFLCDHFTHIDAVVWQERITRGEVMFASGEKISMTTPYQTGVQVFYYRMVDHEAVIPFSENILFQDAHLLVVDKPHFLPVIPSGRFVKETLLTRLKQRTGIADLVPLHRLDRETAGVMLFSVNPTTRGAYQSLFQQKTIHKVYEALAPVSSDVTFPLTYQSRLVRGKQFFLTDEVVGEANSETLFSVLKQWDNIALYQAEPVTGKKHQIRVHMAALGIPIINDKFYPNAIEDGLYDDFLHPLKLLAKSICFTDPLSLEQRYFASQLSLTAAF